MSTQTSPPAVLSAGADVHAGLSSDQVETGRRQYGPNEVLEKKPRALFTFLAKFWGLSAWMPEAIAALSWALHRYADLVIAAALLVSNAVIAFVQERRAEGVVDTLRRRLQVNARVLGEGHWQTLPARELVPGDVIRIRQGEVVPAAAREWDADVIVIGTHGRSGVSRLVLGSTAESVVRHASCPVLVIKPHA